MSILYFYHLLPFFFLEFFYPILQEAIGSENGKNWKESIVCNKFSV